MNEAKRVPTRASLLAVVLTLVVVLVGVMKTTGQEGTNVGEKAAYDQWEYLAVAGPSTTNLSATGNPRMRKEPNVYCRTKAAEFTRTLSLTASCPQF